MEVMSSSETSVDFQRTTWHYTKEDRTIHNHRCENLKSYKSHNNNNNNNLVWWSVGLKMVQKDTTFLLEQITWFQHINSFVTLQKVLNYFIWNINTK
jgi:hypothetical protein